MESSSEKNDLEKLVEVGEVVDSEESRFHNFAERSKEFKGKAKQRFWFLAGLAGALLSGVDHKPNQEPGLVEAPGQGVERAIDPEFQREVDELNKLIDQEVGDLEIGLPPGFASLFRSKSDFDTINDQLNLMEVPPEDIPSQASNVYLGNNSALFSLSKEKGGHLNDWSRIIDSVAGAKSELFEIDPVGEVVVVVGEGATKDEAIVRALERAVAQIGGEKLEGKTDLENKNGDPRLQEGVMTLSEAYVDNYKVKGVEEIKDEKGNSTFQVEVELQPGVLTDRPIHVNPEVPQL